MTHLISSEIPPNAKGASRPPVRGSESGYAYLVVMFMVLVMAVTAQEALQNMYTEGRRQREDEMIWRGNQYARAIRLYYRKTGHYPQDLDALKSGLPDLHFLRYAAYKDPTNKDGDGAWRLIYVNASGQIIGSVRYATLQQMAIMDLNGGQIPAAASLGSIAGTPVSSMASGSNNANSPNGTSNPTDSGSQNPSQTAPGSTTENSRSGAQNSGQAQSGSSDQLVNPLALLKPTGKVDGPVLGGFLTGVGGGSQSDAPSIKVVNGGKKHGDWEFIWNPLEDQARAVQQGLTAPGQTPGQPAGAAGIGTSSTGFGGTIVPPTTQTPPQNQ